MVNIPGRGARAPRRLELRKAPSSGSLRLKLLSCLLILGLCLHISCGEKKQSVPQKPSPSYDLAGEWHSDIESANRHISKSIYTIGQGGIPSSSSLFPRKPRRRRARAGRNVVRRQRASGMKSTLRIDALSWVSGRDTCAFQVRGEMDMEGRLFLHFPGDLCGEKNLPFTRTLYRPESR